MVELEWEYMCNEKDKRYKISVCCEHQINMYLFQEIKYSSGFGNLLY